MHNIEVTAKTEEKLNFAILPVIVIGTFMAVMDGTIVNVSLPKMISVFNSSTTAAQWIVTAYMLTLGIVMPISGYLGTVLVTNGFIPPPAGFCHWVLLVWGSLEHQQPRCLPGLSSAGGRDHAAFGMAILYQNFPREKMGMVLGIWGISMMLAPAIGPTLGGYLVDYLSWRLIFFINVPVGIVNLFMAQARLKETPLIKEHNLDVVGIIPQPSDFSACCWPSARATTTGGLRHILLFYFSWQHLP